MGGLSPTRLATGSGGRRTWVSALRTTLGRAASISLWMTWGRRCARYTHRHASTCHRSTTVSTTTRTMLHDDLGLRMLDADRAAKAVRGHTLQGAPTCTPYRS